MHQQALLSKKLLEMNLARPDTYFPTSADTQEFILHNQYDGFYYYVDTEGHNYARYTFRILNFPK